MFGVLPLFRPSTLKISQEEDHIVIHSNLSKRNKQIWTKKNKTVIVEAHVICIFTWCDLYIEDDAAVEMTEWKIWDGNKVGHGARRQACAETFIEL